MSRLLVLGAVLGSMLLGTGCVVKVTPRPDYDHCVVNSDCESGICADTRVTTTTGGSITGYQCTRGCGSSAACADRSIAGYGGACLMIAGDTSPSSFYCYQGCATTADCPGSGVCTPVTGGAVGYACFPSY